MIMKKILSIILATICFSVSAQNNYLTVSNVTNWWNPLTESGSLDTVLITVEPKGLYAQVSYCFDFSVRGTDYTDNFDSLEMHMVFDMEKEIEVTDLWLWINDSIIVADMYDKWTADQIYNSIVQARTDPAILYRYNSNYYYDYSVQNFYTYDLRVFPLLPNLPRKVRFTLQVPIKDLTTDQPVIELPMSFLNLSNLDIQQVKVRWFDGIGLTAPMINNASSSFYSGLDTNGRAYDEVDYTLSQYSDYVQLQLSNSANNNVFAGHYTSSNGTENIAHLQVNPKEIFQLQNDRKLVYIIDFSEGNGLQLSSSDVYNELKMSLLRDLHPSDSVNILISGFVTRFISSEWVSADSASIMGLLNNFNENDFPNYSNLETSLIDAVGFIQNNGGEGDIVLISNSNNQGDIGSAMGVSGNVGNVMGQSSIDIEVIDLYEGYYPYFSNIGGSSYRGNEYLYFRLNHFIGGHTVGIKTDGLSRTLKKAYKYSGANFSNITLTPTGGSNLSDTYVLPSLIDDYMSVDDPFSLVGVLTGPLQTGYTLTATLSGGNQYSAILSLNPSDLQSLDSLARSIWVGQKLNEMEASLQYGMDYSNIVAFSMDNRVLCTQTAFLALEPGAGSMNPEEPIPVSVLAYDVESIVSIYPNPCQDQFTIDIDLEGLDQLLIEMINIEGRIVKQVKYKAIDANLLINVSVEDLEPGVYFCRISSTNGEISTAKVIVN